MERVRAESGQTLGEYSLVLGVVTAAVVLVLTGMSDAIVAFFQRALDAVA